VSKELLHLIPIACENHDHLARESLNLCKKKVKHLQAHPALSELVSLINEEHSISFVENSIDLFLAA
jgi:hypothetical protein